MIHFRKIINRLCFVLLMLCFPAVTVVSVSAEDRCVSCHEKETFRIQNRVLFDYYNNWKDSLHELAGVTCSDCHGGDPDQKDKDRAHKGDFSSMTALDKSSLTIVPKRCGSCHEEVLKYFTESRHYNALIKKGIGPDCVTCHGSMNAEVYYTSVISRTCRECHNEYTKNRPEVAGEADKILHRINVSRAFKNWVGIYYSEKEPERVRKMNALYQDVADSWHKFDFKKIDEKSEELLKELKSMVNRKLAEKKKKKE